ncbi:kinase-like protein [Trematosphaeria pertusa]|uniref:Kinase-like protein n=1 Tax=Trematosphaeria pertusa TaxID=390896 RepID=A0A6A6HUX9_9PLEO|nr:kinase-like protein [Trematosphaeria pertusa]KAF2241827.1 kinase-like protein [Trematosphaeria pertusa]
MDDDPSLPNLSTKGLDWLGVGVSGIVYALDEHTAVKVAPIWDNDDAATRESLQELLIERSIYERLGSHPRICQYFSSIQRGILLERFGDPIRKHLRALYEQGKTPSRKQALKWSYQLAEGIAYLHQKGVIQGDIGCHNILLKGDDIKVCDFSGASVDGKPHGVRYEKRSQRWGDAEENPSIANELFALGSTIFELWTTTRPYENETDNIVEDNYKHHRFPDVENLPVAKVIRKCWHGTYSSADEVVADLTLCFS